MKKIFLSLAMAMCCLMISLPAQAQFFGFGVKGGLNLSELDSKWYDKGNTTGFFIGPMAEVTIPLIGIGLDAAVMYSQRGKHEWKQQGIEIPVNLKYTIGLGSTFGIFLAAGPDFFFNFKDIDTDTWKSKKTQVGLNLGGGLKLLRKLQMGVNYQIPLGHSFDLREAEHSDPKTRTWQISLAYMF